MLHGLKEINQLFKTTVKVELFVAGSCKQIEKLTIKDGRIKAVHIPAVFAHIKHPTYGSILFDTGYSQHFFEATRKLPYSLYRYVTPVHFKAEQSAQKQLQNRGIDPEMIRYVILSHFHADHISGVSDFPKAKYIYLKEAYESVRHLNEWAKTKAGFLPQLLPEDFSERSLYIDEERSVTLPKTYPFDRGLDIFGDGSIIAVDLPGHASGQIGVLCVTEEYPYFLCADSVWSSRAYEKQLQPHWLTYLIVHNQKQLKESFHRVCQFHQRHPEYQIIPSHCTKIWRTIDAECK